MALVDSLAPWRQARTGNWEELRCYLWTLCWGFRGDSGPECGGEKTAHSAKNKGPVPALILLTVFGLLLFFWPPGQEEMGVIQANVQSALGKVGLQADTSSRRSSG
jgi:hypothetical protein